MAGSSADKTDFSSQLKCELCRILTSAQHSPASVNMGYVSISLAPSDASVTWATCTQSESINSRICLNKNMHVVVDMLMLTLEIIREYSMILETRQQ